MTPLSHLGAVRSAEAAGFTWLAWVSQRSLQVLLVSSFLALGGAPGCIVAQGPEYRERQKTRPAILANTTRPSTQFPIQATSSGSPTEFSIVIQSEDADEQLVLAFYVDYGLPGQTYVDDFPVPASTFDKPKTALIDLPLYTRIITPGCHTLTLLAMHESSWNSGPNLPTPDGIQDDVAVLHWVLHYDVDSNVPPECPDPSMVGAAPPVTAPP